MVGDKKKLTFDQRMLYKALENGKSEHENAREECRPWTECEAETYRTALSLKRRGLIEIHPERNALGDYKARPVVVETQNLESEAAMRKMARPR